VPVTWSDEIDDVLAGDLTAGLAYVTPAGGAVVTAVSPIGLRDRAAGTVTFTTSLGFAKKLERIRREPRVSLAYHDRRHGFSDSSHYVLVQGRAEYLDEPDERYLREVVGPQSERFLGKRRSGFIWDWWLREYYQARVPVTVVVERIVSWPDLRCERPPEVLGAPHSSEPPPSQSAPTKGTRPRVDSEKAARRLSGEPDRLLAFVQADGYPTSVPVDVGGASREGIVLSAAESLLPPGARRAGLLGHDYRAQATGLEARQHTGWLEVSNGRALYAPHTERSFKLPANKTLTLLASGLGAKIGVRRARRAKKEP
jgi:pyridoxamine 5'-phosphate oxidase-like protein